MVRHLEAVMDFDYNWEPGENDSRTGRWIRRILFVVGIVAIVWICAIAS